MSTKATIVLTEDNEHIYFDCVNQFKSDGNYAQEITFEFEKKNIRIEGDDDECLCFSLDKDSEIFRFFNKLFSNAK